MTLGVLAPLYFDNSYDLSRVQLMLVYVTAGIALNFAFGYAGQLALGEPVIMAAGAYTAGLVSSRLGWEVWLSVPLAVFSAVVISVLLGLPSLRVSGWYFALLTFFGIAVYPRFVESFRSVTGGTDGLTGIGPMSIGSYRFDDWLIYEVFFIAAVLSWIAARNLVHSGWGLSIQMMRDHPVAAEACGVDTARAKARVYVLIAIPCGVVGALFAHSERIIAPSHFSFETVLLLIGGVFLGGLGTLWGPVLGIAIFQGITLYLGPFSEYNRLALGVGVLVAAVAFKGGLVPAVRRLGEWSRGALAKRASDRDPALDEEAGSRIGRRPAVGEFNLPPPSITEPELQLNGIEKGFGGNLVLDGVDLQVGSGRVLGLVGANGSGKTTLLNVASGFIPPDGGAVILNGREITGLPTSMIAARGLGRTFQVPKLVDELSVCANVELGLVGAEGQRVVSALLRTSRFRRREGAREKRAREICRLLAFTQAQIDATAGELSLGMKRIVEIGRAIASDASVVCLDEPAAGLNEEERALLAEMVSLIAGSGRGVLLIEHNLSFVLGVCDEIVLLRDGVVAGQGHPERGPTVSRELSEYFEAYSLERAAPTELNTVVEPLTITNEGEMRTSHGE